MNKKYIFIIILLGAAISFWIGWKIYVKNVCAGKHFSCEQNMSIQCKIFRSCIN